LKNGIGWVKFARKEMVFCNFVLEIGNVSRFVAIIETAPFSISEIVRCNLQVDKHAGVKEAT
jgi:hypothetical protein